MRELFIRRRRSRGLQRGASRATLPQRRPSTRWGRIRASASSLRAHSTLVAVTVVAAALAAGGIGLLSLLRTSLHESAEATAAAQMNDVTGVLRLGSLPPSLPVSRADTITQVVADNKVVLSSIALPGQRPLVGVQRGKEGSVIEHLPFETDAETKGTDQDSDGPYLLLSRNLNVTMNGKSQPVTVLVASSLQPMSQATRTLRDALFVGLPPFVILVGVLVWVLGGRALRPVEAIRAEVADISGHDLHRRVPVPMVNDEVGRLARTMNEMLHRLESSASSQRRFVADASHELRSPLAALQVTLEVALAHPDDAAWQEAATDALDEVRRLHRLVEDLLVLARSDEGVSGARRDEPVDLDEVLLREVRMARNVSRATFDMHRVSAGRVRGDPEQLTRVVHNLIDNATRHANSVVSVELHREDDEVVLAISDDGPGIEPAFRTRIFERFARLDEGRSQDDGGTGLGLAIVKEIVTSHGGAVFVAGSERGARFEVRLAAENVLDPEENEVPSVYPPDLIGTERPLSTQLPPR